MFSPSRSQSSQRTRMSQPFASFCRCRQTCACTCTMRLPGQILLTRALQDSRVLQHALRLYFGSTTESLSAGFARALPNAWQVQISAKKGCGLPHVSSDHAADKIWADISNKKCSQWNDGWPDQLKRTCSRANTARSHKSLLSQQMWSETLLCTCVACAKVAIQVDWLLRKLRLGTIKDQRTVNLYLGRDARLGSGQAGAVGNSMHAAGTGKQEQQATSMQEMRLIMDLMIAHD